MGDQAKARSFRALHSSALRSEGPSFEARALFLLLSSYADPDGRNCYPSMERLTADTGHDIKWTKRRLAELHEHGWLSHTWKGLGKGKGRVNLYTLHWSQIGPDRKSLHQAHFVRIHQAQNGPKTCIHRPEDYPPLAERAANSSD